MLRGYRAFRTESIAFYHGEAREAEQADARLSAMVMTARSKVLWTAALALWSNCYTYITLLMP